VGSFGVDAGQWPRWGFAASVGRLRGRHRFVNLVAALLRFPSLDAEAPQRGHCPASTRNVSSSLHRWDEFLA